jgi:hypothetical protein
MASPAVLPSIVLIGAQVVHTLSDCLACQNPAVRCRDAELSTSPQPLRLLLVERKKEMMKPADWEVQR